MTVSTDPRSRTAYGADHRWWHRAALRGCGLALAGAALLILLVAAFTWPPSELAPRDLPIAVVAPPDAADAVAGHLAAKAGEEAFDVTTVDDRDAAIAMIRDREVYGALVSTPDRVEVLVATGAGPMVAQLLDNSARAAPETSVVTTDVVPPASGDPRGAVFSAAALPLALSGVVAGAVASLALRRTADRLATATAIAVVGGLAVTGLVQGAMDALEGSYWANSGVVALGIVAIAFPIVGLFHLAGHAGVGLAALVVLLVGNPLSGVTSAPELVPLGWLGQLLPPGAVGTALRGTAYFDGAGVTAAVAVLLVWAGCGVLLALMPRRARGRTPAQE